MVRVPHEGGGSYHPSDKFEGQTEQRGFENASFGSGEERRSGGWRLGGLSGFDDQDLIALAREANSGLGSMKQSANENGERATLLTEEFSRMMSVGNGPLVQGNGLQMQGNSMNNPGRVNGSLSSLPTAGQSLRVTGHSFGSETTSPCSSGKLSEYQATLSGQTVLPVAGLQQQPMAQLEGSLGAASSSLFMPGYGSVGNGQQYIQRPVHLNNTSKGSGPRLFCGHVPKEVTEEHVRAHFSAWGLVTDVYFPRHKKTLKRRPFCFVTFEKLECAQKALAESPLNICGFPIKNLTMVEDRDKYYHDKHVSTKQTLINALQSSPIVAESSLTKEQIDNVAALLAMDGALTESILNGLGVQTPLSQHASGSIGSNTLRYARGDGPVDLMPDVHRQYQASLNASRYSGKKNTYESFSTGSSDLLSAVSSNRNSMEQQSMPLGASGFGFPRSFEPPQSAGIPSSAFFHPNSEGMLQTSEGENRVQAGKDLFSHVEAGHTSPSGSLQFKSSSLDQQGSMQTSSGSLGMDGLSDSGQWKSQSLDIASIQQTELIPITEALAKQGSVPVKPVSDQSLSNSDSLSGFNNSDIHKDIGVEKSKEALSAWIKASGFQSKTTDMLGDDYPSISRKSI